ncbi:pyridoxal-phosphate dependent enzyme [Alphaproteobacteria bacterium]|nr:pyridoxal-phosphate dependent enzyme [Alphaproteobacteria bacterium]
MNSIIKSNLSKIRKSIGNTPLIKIFEEKNTHQNMYIKAEGLNPTGSIKDRTCLSMLDSISRSVDLSNKILLDASSGNFASALAFMGKVIGLPIKVVCSSKLTSEKSNLIRCFGADLELKGDFTIDGNRYCRNVAQNDERYIFLDQLHNPANPIAHGLGGTGEEILKSLPSVGLIVGSLGSGGTLCGVSKAVEFQQSKTKILGVVSKSGHKLPGVGSFIDGDYETSFIKEFQSSKNSYSIEVDMFESARAAQEKLIQFGFFGPQTGALLIGALEFLKINDIEGDVVLISGDAGWKNVELFDKLLGLNKN